MKDNNPKQNIKKDREMSDFEKESIELIHFIFGKEATPIGYKLDEEGYLSEIWYEIPNEYGIWETRCYKM